MSSTRFSNRLYNAMSSDDRALVGAHLEPVTLSLKHPVERPSEPIEHVYFPESGIISVVAKSGPKEIEAGVIGREGMTGLAIVMGNDRSPNDCYVQVAGEAHRIAVDDLRTAMAASGSLRDLLLRFAQTFLIQVTHTSLANGRAKIEERLARWLLMAHDRLSPGEITLTHEFLSLMLGCRRPGVTEIVHELEGKGLIRAQRGIIKIVDHEGLKETAGAIYGVPEAEYQRLIG